MSTHKNAGSQGAANENRVRNFFELEGYADASEVLNVKSVSAATITHPDYQKRLDWAIQRVGADAFFVLRTKIAGESMYHVPWNVDVFAWHKTVFPHGFVMEVKQQSVAGSVDEKMPFVVGSLLKLSKATGGVSALYLSGGAIRPCAVEWSRSHEGNQDGARFYLVETDSELRYLLKNGKKSEAAYKRQSRQQNGGLFSESGSNE
jgi:hypothetical protein